VDDKSTAGRSLSPPLYFSNINLGMGSNGTRNNTPVLTLFFLIHVLPFASVSKCSGVSVYTSEYDRPVKQQNTNKSLTRSRRLILKSLLMRTRNSSSCVSILNVDIH